MISYTADVFCDKCGDWTHGVTDGTGKRQATGARAAAKKGWSHERRSLSPDLCPNCLDLHRKGL